MSPSVPNATLPSLFASLRGLCVLVVEDEYMLAEDLRAGLEEQGAKVLGPIPSVSEALKALADGPAPDAAILDINLGGEMVYPVAEALRARGIPFIFATGYEAWAIPETYADVPLCVKPVEVGPPFDTLPS